MRIKVFSGVFALALLATAGWGVNKSMSIDAGLSDLALKNVEALANGEVIIGDICIKDCDFCHCYYPPTPEDLHSYYAEGRKYN
jgi:hypothetical protein